MIIDNIQKNIWFIIFIEIIISMIGIGSNP
jgi:hypothetical protein